MNRRNGDRPQHTAAGSVAAHSRGKHWPTVCRISIFTPINVPGNVVAMEHWRATVGHAGHLIFCHLKSEGHWGGLEMPWLLMHWKWHWIADKREIGVGQKLSLTWNEMQSGALFSIFSADLKFQLYPAKMPFITCVHPVLPLMQSKDGACWAQRWFCTAKRPAPSLSVGNDERARASSSIRSSAALIRG